VLHLRWRRWRVLALAPALLWLGAVSVYPLAVIVLQALRPGTSRSIRLFEAISDPHVVEALGRTARLVAIVVPIQLLVGVAVGTQIGLLQRGRTVVLVLVALPMFVPPIAIGLMWRFLLEPTRGPIASVSKSLFGLTVEGFSTTTSAFRNLALISIWQWSAFVAIVVAVAVATTPRSLLDQAFLDGLTPAARFRNVIWPRIRESALILLLVQTLETIRTFDLVYVLTQGGPGTATELLSFLVFERAFQFNDPAGAAGAVMMMWGISTTLMMVGLFVFRVRLSGRSTVYV